MLRASKSLAVLLTCTALMSAGCATAINPVEAGAAESQQPSTIVTNSHATMIDALVTDKTISSAFDHIVSQGEQNLKDLIELTETPAPPFGEDVRAARLVEMIKEAGLSDVSIDGVGNVIARRAGKTGAETVAIVAHVDTVFPIETDVNVRVDGDVYHSPGIGDNTRGLIVLLGIIKAMEAKGIETEADVLFIGSVGEEGLGDLRGVKHLFRDGAPKIDSFVAVDGGGLGRLIYGGVGSTRYRVTVKGPGGHSWGDFGDANPHHALGRAITYFDERAPDVTGDGPKSSYNVGRIGGGTSINSVPFESWMEVDMRSGDTGKLAAIEKVFLQAMQDGLDAENADRLGGPELTIDLDKVGERPAGKGSPDQALVQRSMAAMKSLGIKPSLRISSTDSNIPISLGVPAVTISRGGVTKGAHSLSESWQDIDAHKSIQLGLLIILAEAGYLAK